ncbi:MAG TPA: pyridoxamine kinase [Bacillota bacterium]|nr:pyridoxamine kinase [Clostridiales bacterium]HPT85914.1 pyridoxamine kinase [Bacillota bacterium]
MKRQKRVAAIHDISCFGRCSLTVALPIISAAGIECSVIPTALLSTHTGGITGYTFLDLTDEILPIASHWQSLGLEFDGLYSGFLGSFEQIDVVSEVFDRFRSADNLIVVDPVMADNGVLYKVFPPTFPSGMRKLCAKADVIIPNITEATLLLDEPYLEGPYTQSYIEGILERLSKLGPKQVILTGVYFKGDHLGAASYDARTGEVSYAFDRLIEGYYHGTGDVFGSALVASLISGKSLAESTSIAVDFTVKSILRTKAAGTDIRFGVNFEAGLRELAEKLA